MGGSSSKNSKTVSGITQNKSVENKTISVTGTNGSFMKDENYKDAQSRVKYNYTFDGENNNSIIFDPKNEKVLKYITDRINDYALSYNISNKLDKETTTGKNALTYTNQMKDRVKVMKEMLEHHFGKTKVDKVVKEAVKNSEYLPDNIKF